MKSISKKSGLVVAILIVMSVFNNKVKGQNTETCEKIVMEIYDGINLKKASHLLKYLADDFSMAGQKGEIAKMIFPEYIAKLGEKVSGTKKIKETQTDVLTLIYGATFADMGMKNSTFVFDKSNKLLEMDLLPTKVQQQ